MAEEKASTYYSRLSRVRCAPQGRNLVASPPRKWQLVEPCASFYLPTFIAQVHAAHGLEDMTWHTVN